MVRDGEKDLPLVGLFLRGNGQGQARLKLGAKNSILWVAGAQAVWPSSAFSHVLGTWSRSGKTETQTANPLYYNTAAGRILTTNMSCNYRESYQSCSCFRKRGNGSFLSRELSDSSASGNRHVCFICQERGKKFFQSLWVMVIVISKIFLKVRCNKVNYIVVNSSVGLNTNGWICYSHQHLRSSSNTGKKIVIAITNPPHCQSPIYCPSLQLCFSRISYILAFTISMPLRAILPTFDNTNKA